MGKDLKSLIRLGRFAVDEKRRALGELLAREEQVIEAQRHLEEDHEAQRAAAAADGDVAGFTFGAYVAAYLRRREQLARLLDAIQAEIARSRDEVAEAFRELKSYELAQATREKRERAERDRKEQAALDEIGLAQFRRRGAGEA